MISLNETYTYACPMPETKPTTTITFPFYPADLHTEDTTTIKHLEDTVQDLLKRNEELKEENATLTTIVEFMIPRIPKETRDLLFKLASSFDKAK